MFSNPIYLQGCATVDPYCSEDQFTCNKAQCVPGNFKCNFYEDCGDKSDEVTFVKTLFKGKNVAVWRMREGYIRF